MMVYAIFQVESRTETRVSGVRVCGRGRTPDPNRPLPQLTVNLKLCSRYF